MTAFIPPPTAVTGNVITAVDINAGHNNDNHFNELVPTPTSWPRMLVAKAADDGDWDLLSLALIPDGLITAIKLATGAAVGNLANGSITSALLEDGTIVNGDISASAAIALSKLAAVPITKSGDSGVGSLVFDASKTISFATENGTKIDLASNGQYLVAVASNVWKMVTARDFEIWNSGAGAASLVYNTATHVMTINGQTVIHTGSTGGVSAGMLASGAAANNLGYTPARIASGTYAGNNGTTARQITAGFACKFVYIQENSQNAAWFINNTTKGMLIAQTGPTIGGTSALYLHASDGFVVADGAATANVSGRDYLWTAFG